MQNEPLKYYLYRLGKQYKVYVILLILASIASTALVFADYQIQDIIDTLASNKKKNIFFTVALYVLYMALGAFVFFIYRLVDLRYKPSLIKQVTQDMYNKTMEHSLQWFDSHLSGEITEKINGFQSAISEIISDIFFFAVIFWRILIALLLTSYIHYLSATVQLVFLLIYAPVMFFLLKKQMELQGSYVRITQKMVGVINDSVSNIFGVKIIGNLKSEQKLKLNPVLIERQKWEKITRHFDAWWVDNSDTLMFVGMIGVQMFVTASLYQNGEITAGGFAFIAIVMARCAEDISNLIEKVCFSIIPKIVTINTSYDFINEPYTITNNSNAKILKTIKGNISFDQVCFAYNARQRNILNNINLEIKAGEKIGLVGSSGVGKSTLIKCLLRYFDIQSGAISIDGNSIINITQESLREHISVIPQDITMFHRSILENLQLAKYDASKEEVIKACQKAKIHKEILEMDNGYDSIVGERGVKVSGGQRQRLAIAMAILKDAPILILDEATSSLDSQTEKHIQESLDKLIKDKSKTVIAIAHRLSTLKHMDRIIVLDKGNVVEEGRHDALLTNKNSIYKKLWDLQII